jgi:hypothetical protein
LTQAKGEGKMKRLTLTALSIIFLVTACLWADGTKVIEMNDLINPASLKVDGDQIYFTEGAQVLIYSRTDFKLKKKFGKKGEGPREFFIHPTTQYASIDLEVIPEGIRVNSIFKTTVFTKDGTFVSEKKVAPWAWFLTPVGKNFFYRRTIMENNLRYHVIRMTDADFKSTRDVYKELAFFQANKPLNVVYRRPANFISYDNKLFVDNEEEGLINVFDEKGEKLYTIKHAFKKVPFTEKVKQSFIEFYMADPIIKPQFENSKHMVQWPEHLPVIWNHTAADKKLYVLTREKKDNNYAVYVFDMKGKFLRTVMLPIKQMHAEQPYPYDIADNTLYQVVENEDAENWELHVTKFK